MGRVIDTTNIPTSYEIITQTPKNNVIENYFIRTLQEKIWADWEYRPNRVDIEQEQTIGESDFLPIEVVIQTIKTDKGEKVSDNYKRIVFKDLNHKARLGTKFRFAQNFDPDEPNEDKCIWLATNKDGNIPQESVVVTRCNGTLGSIYIDEQGKKIYHYEPCICATELTATNFYYTNTIVTSQSQIIIVVQHNKYTRLYYENQRFVVGYDKVYKVKGLNKFNSLKTFDPTDVDTIVIYAEIDEISAKDDFVNRIALNKEGEVGTELPVQTDGTYTFEITSPSPLPTDLFSRPVQFNVGLYMDGVLTPTPIQVSASLDGPANPNDYYELNVIDNNTFILRRKKLYNRAKLVVRCYIPASDSPTGEEFTQSFELSMRGLE